MRRLARDEAGFTLVELLLAATLMLVILGATLTTLNSFQSNAQTNARQNDAQDEARRVTIALARQLRNLASPTNETPDAIKRHTPHDLIVQSIGDVRPTGSENVRNTQYVRFCYQASTGRVLYQKKTWTTPPPDPDYPATTECGPTDGWNSTNVMAQHIVNGTRPLFTYNSTDPLRITEIHTSLYVDVNPGRRPAETSLFTSVFLRNQNRVPIARFTAARDGTSVVLNGSESEDPEERSLFYDWYEAGTPPTLIGQGMVFVHSASPGNHTYYLEVRDQANLKGTADEQTICVPGGTVTC